MLQTPDRLSDAAVVRPYVYQPQADRTLTSTDVVEDLFPAEAVVLGFRPRVPAALIAAQGIAPLRRLRQGWDSYGALPLAAQAVDAASFLLQQLLSANLRSPDLVPTVRGGVSLEWTSSGREFSITFESPPTYGVVVVSAYYINADSGEEWETDRADTDPRVAAALQGLASESS